MPHLPADRSGENSSCGPLVSVAAPIYNQEQYLADTLESILAQDYDNLQIVLSDDASADRTLYIAHQYRDRHPDKIIVQSHPKNLGVTENARSIASLLKGKYVCWFSGDDLMLPGKIRRQVEVMEANPAAVMSYHNVNVLADGRTLYPYNGRGPGQIARDGMIAESLLLYRCFIPACSVMVKASAAEGLAHRSELTRASDWLYFVELSLRGPVLFIDDILGTYRRHSNNLSNIVDVRDEECAYDLIDELCPEFADTIAAGRVRLYLAYLFKYALAGNKCEAVRMLRSLAISLGEAQGTTRVLVTAFAEFFAQRMSLFWQTGKITR